MTKVAVVEWQDGLVPGTKAWSLISERVNDLRPDILVTNEMPFGQWLPTTKNFVQSSAEDWVRVHDAGIDALASLNVATIVSSRPVMGGSALANEAFLLENGHYRFLHQKHFFPAEPGWEEASWFKCFRGGFVPKLTGNTIVASLLCTELMFTEHARSLGHRGAHLIAAPRATGNNRVLWHSAGTMAAASAGAYVVSSNRAENLDDPSGLFEGGGFAFDPSGKLLGTTSLLEPIVVVNIDESVAEAAKLRYPAYVSGDCPTDINQLEREPHAECSPY